MPTLESKIEKFADKKGLKGKKKDAYVYGTTFKILGQVKHHEKRPKKY